MRNRNWLLIAGATVALAIVLALPALTWARGPGGGMAGGPEQSLVAVAAQVVGISQADLVAQLQSGKTINDVAGDKAPAIVEAFMQPRADRLAAMVASNRLTQAEADQMLATMRATVTARMSEPWTARGPGNGTGPVDADGNGVCDHAGTGMGPGASMGPGSGAGMGHGRMGMGRTR